MSALQDLLFAHRCTSIHQKIALDSLRHLQSDDAVNWQRLFLKHAESLLIGASAPDATFKDFRNHVLHVREKCWGGAVESVESWYKQTVESLEAKEWGKAAYAAGVLSHYYADPHMPLHTALTEEAGIIHRACERSVFRSYNHLAAILERDLGGYPDIKTPAGSRWLCEMVKTGARRSHEHYDVLIDHYNPAKGRWNPAAGLDDEIRVSLAECLGHAVVGFARILDRATRDAGVTPPKVWLAFNAVSARMRIPAMRWSRWRAGRRDTRIVKATYKEYRKLGKVINALPEDEQVVRRLHAEEVLKTTLETLNAIKPRPVGSKYGTGTYLRPMVAAAATRSVTTPHDRRAETAHAQLPANLVSPGHASSSNRSGSGRRQEEGQTARPGKPVPRLAKFHLDPSSSLADAPSIAHRTAEKLAAVGIRSVCDLLAKKPEDVAGRLKLGHVKPETVREWQVQARLACRIPNLRSLDVKILVACGICEPEELARCEALDLLDRVDLFISTSEGQRAIRGGSQPDLDIVTNWIESARHARTLKAA